VLTLSHTIRFLVMDLLQSHCNFKYHCTTAHVKPHTKSFWHSLISFLLSPPTADSLNHDPRFCRFWLNSWQLTISHISSSSDTAFHWNYSHFQNELSVIVGFSLHSFGSDHSTKNTFDCLAIDVLYCCVFVGTCLPSNVLFTKNLPPREGVYRAVT
jgi:hypothetical protein